MASTLLLEVGVMFSVVAVCSDIADRVGLSAVPFDIVAGIVSGSSSSIITTSLIGLGGLANSESEPIPAVTVGYVLVLSSLGRSACSIWASSSGSSPTAPARPPAPRSRNNPCV